MKPNNHLLEHAVEIFPAPDRVFERIERIRNRRQRNRRIRAVAVGLIIAVAGSIGFVQVFRSGLRPQPANSPSVPTGDRAITPQNVGDLRTAWVGSVPDADQGVQELLVGSDGIFAAGRDLEHFDTSCADGSSCAATPTGISSANPFALPTLANGVIYASGRRLTAFPASCQTKPCSPLWWADPGTGPYRSVSKAVVSNDVVYVAADENVFAYPTRCVTDGSECPPLGSAHAPHIRISAHVTVAGGTVVLEGGRGDPAYGFSTACVTTSSACRPLWTVQPGSGFPFTSALGADGLIYVVTNGELVAYSDTCASRCRPMWTARIPGVVEPELVAGDGYVFAAAGGEVLAFPSSCASGGTACNPSWSTSAVPDLQWMTESDRLLVLSSAHSGLEAFPVDCGTAGETCEPLWTVPGLFGQPVVSASVVFAAGGQPGRFHQLFAFDANCGTAGAGCRSLWVGTVHGSIQTGPVLSGGSVYVGTGMYDEKVVAFRLGTGAAGGSSHPRYALVLLLVLVGALAIAEIRRRRTK